MLVGEAYGKDEEEAGRPFVGASGFYLNQLLAQVGISRSECYVTNVFNLRPKPSNDVSNLCGPKAEGIPGMPPLRAGKYIRAEYASELTRLYKEIKDVQPNLVVALGATPTWALCHTSGIRKLRGAPTLAHADVLKLTEWSGKVLPTYHPAAMMRDMSLRPVLLADLDKARREQEFPDIRRPQREIWVEPNLTDLALFEQEHINPSPFLSIDIETKGRQITCIGFAPTKSVALVVPFYDPSRADGNYWRTFTDELAAWRWVRRICALRKRIVFQNGLYDIRFLWEIYGIPVPHTAEDTMLLHHALQPELEKGLGFLGTIYTDEAQWKFMRTKHDTAKKED